MWKSNFFFKFLVKLGNTNAETYEMLKTVFKGDIFSALEHLTDLLLL
jgi:hypothetical protein